MTDGFRPIVVVTGASGFIASHVIRQLLASGAYSVRGTVMNDDEAWNALSTFPEIELFLADLNKDDGWKEAIAGSTFVLHLACPFQNDSTVDKEEVIRPSVDGARRVLQACVDSGTVRRFVFTSGVAAITGHYGEHRRTYTEADWADPAALAPNQKAKTLAERAVWDFMENLEESKRFEFVVLNPCVVMGPLLIGPPTSTLQLIVKLLEKTITGCPRISIPLIDVRDVAKAHLVAMTSQRASGKRYLLYSESIWMQEIAFVIRDEFAIQGYDIPTGPAPLFMVRIASLTSNAARSVLARVGKEPYFSTTKMREELGVTPSVKLTDSIIDTCYSVIDKGFATRKARYRPREEAPVKRKQKAAVSWMVPRPENTA